MFTEEQLVSFGNYILERYNVKEYSTDGTNTPLSQRHIYDADIRNWIDKENPDQLQLPSLFQHGDRARFTCIPDDPMVASFPGIPCEIIGVHFYPGKVKYDLDLLFIENQRSRIYNVDSILVIPL